MAHGIEEFADGSAAIVSAREPMWHRLGTIADEAMTADEALRLGQLDWQVAKTTDPIAAPVMTDSGLSLISLDNKFLTYREHPKTGEPEALGVVGTQYEVIQNSEAFSFLNHLTDEYGAVFETAGSLHGGRKVFMSMKMPQSMMIGGHDEVELYLLAWNTHDGSSAFNVVATPQRVVCQNTLTAGISRAASTWSIRHTRTAAQQVQQARDTMGLSFKFAEAFQQEADALLAQEMTRKEFDAMVAHLVVAPKDATDKVKANVEGTRLAISSLWEADTQANIAGTKWAAWNAVTEWADHYKPVKNDDPYLRAMRVVTDLSGLNGSDRPLNVKRKAWRLLTATV